MINYPGIYKLLAGASFLGSIMTYIIYYCKSRSRHVYAIFNFVVYMYGVHLWIWERGSVR